MIRPAIFGDIPRLYDLLHEGYERSKYREHGTVDTKATKALLMNAVQRHGLKHEGGTCVFVSERSGLVDGLILGTLNRVYFIGSKLMAQDVFFYTNLVAHPTSAVELFDAYIAWGESVEAVFEIKASSSDIIGDPERVEALYLRKGFVRCGSIFERRVGR